MSSVGKDVDSEYKKTLLSRLLAGVKGCQSRFGSRSELATEDDASVARLCVAYEDVFTHGFQNKSAQQSSTSKANFWMPTALRSSESTSFWPLIKSQLSKHEAERFLLLHNVRTDAGRCRAWIRASLNEHSLERYILIILSLENLYEFYHESAFLRDQELNSLLPQTAAGLGSVLFALNVDSPSLDTLTKVMEKDVPEATSIHDAQDTIEIADQAILALSPTSLVQSSAATVALAKPMEKVHSEVGKSSSKGGKKKKKKPPVNFVSFDDDDDQTGSIDSLTISTSSVYSLPAATVSTPTERKSHALSKDIEEKGKSATQSHADLDEMSQTKESISENENRIIGNDQMKDSENDSSEPSTEAHTQACPTSSYSAEEGTAAGPDPSTYSTSVKSADCISVNSVYSDCSERLDLDSVNLAGLEVSPSQRLKPITSDHVFGGNSVKCTSTNPDSAHDLIPVPSYDSATLAPALNLDVEHYAGSSGSSKIHSPITPTTPGRTNEPLPLSVAKDGQSTRLAGQCQTTSVASEEAIQKLKGLLDREIETVATLRADLAEEKRSSSNSIKMLEAKIESLSKENEILRHQLKKYVGAVQLLKREGSRRLSMEDDDTAVNNCSSNDIDDASQEAAEYERKLIQVAEMHGELMEFNSHLQRTLQRKDAAIKRLKEELVDLRGPLATPLVGDEDEDDDSWDIVESFSSESAVGRSVSNRRPGSSHSNERILINIWIPSAFLTGATNDLHHVYQVFLRIKDTEWNIYRRYSQFYTLHRDLSKNDPIVASLYFPPKKHLGNKDARFVDERRRKLQEYLRGVMNHTLQTNSILASHPEKNLLISILPFFGESFNTQTQKPKRERSRSRSLFFRQAAQPAQQPNQGQLQFSNYPQYTGL